MGAIENKLLISISRTMSSKAKEWLQNMGTYPKGRAIDTIKMLKLLTKCRPLVGGYRDLTHCPQAVNLEPQRKHFTLHIPSPTNASANVKVKSH